MRSALAAVLAWLGVLAWLAVLAWLGVLARVAGAGVGYCGARMCAYSDAHTLCQYPEGPGPSCAGYVAASLSAAERARVLARLNARRAHAAAGRLRLPAAADMLRLRWVEELARAAQRWADQCRPPDSPDERDACRDLYAVSVGQSVASVVGEAPGLLVESMADLWYMQNIHYKGNVTAYTPPMSVVNYYGDFAQLVWSRAFLVGCGRSRFMVQQQDRLRSVERLVCNFAPRGPASGERIWTPDEPASLCPPGSVPDTEYRGLCVYQSYSDMSNDIINKTSVEERILLSTVLEIEMNNDPRDIDELYLTKVAIATLEDKAKTESYYNNFQKRDVVMSNNMSQVNKENKGMKVLIRENISYKPARTTTRIKLIGRPKSYNADELLGVGGAQTTNNYEIPTDLPKDRKEFYDDYQYSEPQDESISQSDNNETVTQTINNMTVGSEISLDIVQRTADNVNINITSDIAYPISNLSILNVTYGFEAEMGLMNVNINESVENANRSLKDDEFLSDPESVRDLQEALSQMEQSLETSTTTAVTLEKAKRAIREIPESRQASEAREPHTLPPHLQDLNFTADKAPMLNMVLRYLPYLKPYRNEILGKVTNIASLSPPSCVVSCCVFVACFFM